MVLRFHSLPVHMVTDFEKGRDETNVLTHHPNEFVDFILIMSLSSRDFEELHPLCI